MAPLRQTNRTDFTSSYYDTFAESSFLTFIHSNKQHAIVTGREEEAEGEREGVAQGEGAAAQAAAHGERPQGRAVARRHRGVHLEAAEDERDERDGLPRGTHLWQWAEGTERAEGRQGEVVSDALMRRVHEN